MRVLSISLLFILLTSTICQLSSHKLISLDNFQPQQLNALLSGDWKQLFQATFSQFQQNSTNTTNTTHQYQPPEHQSFENIFKRHFMKLNQLHLERHKLTL
jgi:hypothetical protein